MLSAPEGRPGMLGGRFSGGGGCSWAGCQMAKIRGIAARVHARTLAVQVQLQLCNANGLESSKQYINDQGSERSELHGMQLQGVN